MPADVEAGDLAVAALVAHLTTARLGRDYVFLPSCGSTNDEVGARASAGAPEGLLVAADAQTGGRGRRGRSWHSPAGQNLYCSLLLRPALPAERAAPLTLLVGLAVARALAALGFAPVLKWPNDVLLDAGAGPRKVAGILTEMTSEGGRIRHLVVGLGLDVNTESFPTSLVDLATSLRVVSGRAVDRAAVLAGVINAFEPIYEDFLAHGPAAGLAEWTRRARLGQGCWIERGGRRIDGIAEGIDEGGALLLRTAGGERVTVHAGEVNWR